MTTYEQLHAGDIVHGADGGGPWGVAGIQHAPGLAVALVRGGQQVIGYPAAGTEVEVVHQSDVSAEFVACEILGAGLGPIEIVRETWTE